MKALIIQALLELAGEEGYRGNVQRFLEGHGEANLASDLADKLLAKGVQLPPASAPVIEPLPIPHAIAMLPNSDLYSKSRKLERVLGHGAATDNEYNFIKRVIATRGGYAHPGPKY